MKNSVYNSKTHKNETKSTTGYKVTQRENFIKQHGKEEFERICKLDEEWAKLKDIEFPKMYIWLFNHFYAIWRSCEVDFAGNVIFRPRDIIDYCECFGVILSYRERHLVMKMRDWAFTGIGELKKSEE